MSEIPDSPEERAAIRRRWITLGELLGIAAVLISGLTFWNSYRERANSEAEHHAEESKADARTATLLLRATPADGGRRLTLAPANPDQSIQTQTIAFPGPLGLAPVDTTGEARIESAWFEDALKKARRAAGLKDDARGDERLPIALTTHYLADGAPRTDIAIYDVGYRLEGHFLGGSSVRLRGLSLHRRVGAKDAQRALDSLWPPRK